MELVKFGQIRKETLQTTNVKPRMTNNETNVMSKLKVNRSGTETERHGAILTKDGTSCRIMTHDSAGGCVALQNNDQ